MKGMLRFLILAVILGLLALPAGSAQTGGPTKAKTASAASAPDDEDQPHMQAALDALKQAEQHLNEAKHDKGGHRVAALKATREAIKHVEEGMKAGDKK